LSESYKATEDVVAEHWVVIQGVAEALLQVETLDGELIHQAFEKAKEGMSAADITAWILEQAKKAEDNVAPPPTAPKIEEPKKRTEAPQPPKTLEPRPADG
jgi:hypothetical protein